MRRRDICNMITSTTQFDIQGHRGCRGLMPENTIAAFLKAVELGVTTLELDVVITVDHQVLVSHDPFMSHEICMTPDGTLIGKHDEKSHNIFKMSAATAQQYDCGLKEHKKFPDQQKMKAAKPLLSDMIEAVESYVAVHNLKPVYYNIETKCTPGGDGVFHPEPEVFAELLMKVVYQKNIAPRTLIQSFDVRTLQYLKLQKAPVQLVLLVENIRGVTYNLKKLGFNPDVYSPYYKLLTANRIKFLHEKGLRVIPWTVNETKDMQNLITKGVDGIITDYPDRLIEVLKDFSKRITNYKS